MKRTSMFARFAVAMMLVAGALVSAPPAEAVIFHAPCIAVCPTAPRRHLLECRLLHL